ncbi:galactose-1-phosphate uridylyltransferase [Streptomyces sp. MUM 178J]|uniref:galactose-1-phosphate uridylyltransferase n=1 Tax=Streptomyces sp. MUM 178J TaxID=2791991 RepID=UPI001F043B94|nr:galactose-1-phosphate uridylyltransferase [Streptomyces sp. MUM 178J]WRQ79816.1 galactose-1-phosphate uridylyltransferase [Streptomyces sp. MUM 178J]
MKKTSTRLADGRELLYYDSADGAVRDRRDRRRLDPATAAPTTAVRRDPLLGDAVAIASHRQDRTCHPPADECPLCPSRDGRLTEVPAPDYEVVVFENRFPSLSRGAGRCEVVCFTPDHDASFASLTEERAGLVLAAWTDRTAELAALPHVEQVFCFENRGAEIGVTLGHPHGQIYAYPFVTPRTALMLRSTARHLAATGRNLFDDVVGRELAERTRVVLEGEHWVAFVPYAAHWPYEVHLYPRRRVPDLLELDGPARTEFPQIYLELLKRFDRIFGEGAPPTPYVAAWHQAPVAGPDGGAANREAGNREAVNEDAANKEAVDRGEFGLHLELFTVRRAFGRLKFLAGSESGMNVFINDVPPETAAHRLREVASK